MKAILSGVIKKKVINHITKIGTGVLEIVIELPISFITFNSIEYLQTTNKIMLHHWTDDDLEMTYDFDDLEDEDKLEIFKILSEL